MTVSCFRYQDGISGDQAGVAGDTETEAEAVVPHSLDPDLMVQSR